MIYYNLIWVATILFFTFRGFIPPSRLLNKPSSDTTKNILETFAVRSITQKSGFLNT